MALERFQNMLAGRLQAAQLENQLARQAKQDELANRLAQMKQDQSFRPKAFQPVPVVDASGNVQLVGPSFSANESKWNVSPLDLPEGTSLLKQSPGQSSAMKVEEKQKILRAESEAARKKEQEKVTGKMTAERWAGQIDTGYEAIDALPIIKRNLELMNLVETGGIDAALIKGKQILGVESANEAELAQNIGKAVLKQLKPTFGAQFTVQEGRELKGIEAGLGKSTKGNIRLLTRAAEIYTRAAERGMKAAKRLNDMDTYNQLQEGLNYTFQPAEQQEQSGWAILPE